MAEAWLAAPPRLAALGFSYDPFGALDGETIDFATLDETFVELAPHQPTTGRLNGDIYTLVRTPGHSVAVVGPPGSGKTALRRMVEEWLRSASPESCSVRLRGLERLATHTGPLALADYVRPVLSSVAAVITNHLLARPALLLEAPLPEQSWWWNFLHIYHTVEKLEVRLQGHPQLQESFSVRAPLKELFASDTDLTALLDVVRVHLQTFGYKELVLFVDGVENAVSTEEDDQLDEAVARLLRPILRTQGLYRLRGISWKLFLPEALNPSLQSAPSVRKRWLTVYSLVWTPPALDALLARRLEWASLGTIDSLERISEEAVTLSEPLLGEPGSPLHRRLAVLALAHPSLGPVRTLLSLASELFTGDLGQLDLQKGEWQSLMGRFSVEMPASATIAVPGDNPADGESRRSSRPSHATVEIPPICELKIRLDETHGVVKVSTLIFSDYEGHQPKELLSKATTTGLRVGMPELIALHAEPLKYGMVLTRLFFKQPRVREAFIEGFALAVGARAKLRIRLALPDDHPGLHAFRWELLQHPKAEPPLSLSLDDSVLFARSLPLRAYDRARRRSRGPLTSLVAIAAPEENNPYQLSVLPSERLFDALERAQPGGQMQRLSTVSLSHLDRYQPPDMMILVCHGRVVDGQPHLYLHDDQGTITHMHGGDLLKYLAGQAQKPTFWVLASCQSAGLDRDGDEHALNALGPQMARIGVGAVLAFADTVASDAILVGLPTLVEELDAHGHIELAVARMRRSLSYKSKAWWQSVVYLGLDDGRLWRQA